MNTPVRELFLQPAGSKPTRILVGSGIIDTLPARVHELGSARRVFAVVDEVLTNLHPGLLPEDWPQLILPGGEAAKNLATLEHLLRSLARAELDRQAILVAVGGGSLGDLVGLAASLYLRGIDFVQVPTTLLAMLDSSVGGKTAINLEEGKNLVGTFWPPPLMVADVDLLETLPRDQLLSGLAEAIKMGIGFSSTLYELMSSQRDGILAGTPELLVDVVAQAVQEKIHTVEADPKEQTGRRRCLNLGHTLGHALEAHSDYTILHGHAVARGLHLALDVSARRGLMDAPSVASCHELLESYGFDQTQLPPTSELMPYLFRDKKMQDGHLHMVLPTGIGTCKTVPMAPEELFSLTS